MKSYLVEVVLETGAWTDGWACGRCEDAELLAGKIVMCLSVEAHTKEEALTKAVTAARTAIRNAGTATLRCEPTALEPLDGDEPELKLLHDRNPPIPPRQDRSSFSVNGADCWAVTVRHGTGFPMRSSLLGCWVSVSGS